IGSSYVASPFRAIMPLTEGARTESLMSRARAFGTERRDVIRSGFSSLALRVAGMICTFGLGVILARTLGPAEFGIYGLVIAVATLTGAVAQLGTPQLAV